MLKLLSIIFLLYGSVLYSQDLEYAKSIINTLASEKYMGRGYVGKADFSAAEFISNEFYKIRLQSLSKNYFQFFRLNVNTFPGKMEVKLKDEILIPGIDYLVDPSCPTIKANFKITKIPASDLNKPEKLNYLIESAGGNCILIDLTDTTKFSKEELENSKKIIDAIKYDPSFKNSLTIIFSNQKLTWSVSDWQSKKSVILMNASGLNLDLISEIDINIEAEYLGDYKTQNVAGMIKGRSDSDSFLVLTAHYDHLGIMGKGTIFPGANDNASGVAMMLNICKYFSVNPPEYNMVFIAFSAEEAGLLGSQYFAQHPLIPLNKIKFLINYDLAGTGDKGIKVVNATIYKTEFEILKQINTNQNFLPSVEARGAACISDHCIFHMNNVPCFYIYTLGGISAYHDIFDRAETLPLTEFEDYFKLMISFLNSF